MRKIPKTMSTQHPDNATLPFWAKSEETLQGEDEIYEAYYVFKEFGCEEQMWDWEGKDVDPNVVRKLLQNFPEFFKEKVIGRDIFLTYRLPNPSVEIAERKWFLEVLESIPRSYDVAKTFYCSEIPPIFEVILPLTRSCNELIRTVESYRRFVIDFERVKIDENGCEIRDWVGEFKPREIEVIPLIEDKESIINTDKILEGYIKKIKPKYIRVFIARSDPALNYGVVPAVILSKIAISKIRKVEKRSNVKMFPIIGAGTPPFRGNLSPENLENFLEEYGSYYTVTIQSALKYDFPFNSTKRVVTTINKREPSEAIEIEEEEEKMLIEIINKFEAEYATTIEKLASFINFLSVHVPNRRARRLHIGLFGYAREVRGIKLPRVIGFVAVLYSLGIPPEIIGISTINKLNEREMKTLEKVYLKMKEDIKASGEYLCYENINLLKSEKDFLNKFTKRFKIEEALRRIEEDIKVIEENIGIKLGPKSIRGKMHYNLSNSFLLSLVQEGENPRKYLVEAARIRRFLG